MRSIKKTARQKIVKELDAIVSKIVRLQGQCVLCGSKERLTAGHMFSRRSYSTRWNPLNVFCQCLSCNYYHTYNPEKFYRWFRGMFSPEVFDEIYETFLTSKPIKTFELENLLRKKEIDYEKLIEERNTRR